MNFTVEMPVDKPTVSTPVKLDWIVSEDESTGFAIFDLVSILKNKKYLLQRRKAKPSISGGRVLTITTTVLHFEGVAYTDPSAVDEKLGNTRTEAAQQDVVIALQAAQKTPDTATAKEASK